MTNPPQLPNAKPEKKPYTATEVLVANLSLPGSGTMLAGQKVHGVCQMATAAVGFLMTTYFAVWFLADWLKTGVFPVTALNEAGQIPASWIAPLLIGFGGVVVFVFSLAWAFVTSLVIRGGMKPLTPES